MHYIGSKKTLFHFIDKSIKSVVGEDLRNYILCDLFAGTGTIGKQYSGKVKKIIANDTEQYAYQLNKAYLCTNNLTQNDVNQYIDIANTMNSIEGFIYKNYCSNGRMYFTEVNGRKIDGIYLFLERIKLFSDSSYNHKCVHCNFDEALSCLMASLIESADKVSNTSSAYYSYLKHYKKEALNTIQLKPVEILPQNKLKNQVYNMDAKELVSQPYCEGDILYLDPPYNTRQYGAYYHLLNQLTLDGRTEPAKNITGVGSFYHSAFSSKRNVKEAFVKLIQNARFKYIFLSYNNEGILPFDFIKKVMSDCGKYDCFSTDYKRFTTHKIDDNTVNKTVEYLHVLEKK